MNFKHRPLTIALISGFASMNAAADNIVMDDTMVVTANAGFEKKITDAPASISVITQQDLAQKKLY